MKLWSQCNVEATKPFLIVAYNENRTYAQIVDAKQWALGWFPWKNILLSLYHHDNDDDDSFFGKYMGNSDLWI